MSKKVSISPESLKRYNDLDVDRLCNILDWFCDIHKKRCAKCGVTRMEHEDRGTHPFFENNLEMLEWYNEQRTKAA